MDVIIIEDEPLAAQRLESLIKKYDAEICVICRLSSVEESIEWLTSNKLPDLIFMDIKLEDGDCFDIIDKIKITAPIIFTTAYENYIINAFKVHSIDYLLKPVNFEKLSFSIDKFKELQLRYNNYVPDIRKLFEMFKSSAKAVYKSHFIVSVGQKIKTYNINDIAYFYFDNKITFLVTNDNIHYTIDYSMDSLCSLLDPLLLFRVNRQFIVKRSAIVSIIIYPKYRYLLTLNPPADKEIIVSVARASDFKEWLEM